MEVKEFNRLLKLHKTDKQAKYEFCIYCLTRIKGYLKAIKIKEQEIEDIAHSVLLNILDKPPDFVFAPYKYVCKATKNYLINCYKQSQKEPVLIDDLSFKESELPYEIDYTSKEFYDIVKKYCNEIELDLLRLHFKGFKEKEVAELYNINYDAVRARYCRLFKKIKLLYTECHNR